MATHTMHGKVMIFWSSRVHKQKAMSRDAIMPDTSRSTLACGDHPNEPTRAVCEHASTCARLQCGLSQLHAAITAQRSHGGKVECWGELRDVADGRSGFLHRGRARPNSPRKGGRQLGFHLDLKVALGGYQALVTGGTLSSAPQARTGEISSLTMRHLNSLTSLNQS